MPDLVPAAPWRHLALLLLGSGAVLSGLPAWAQPVPSLCLPPETTLFSFQMGHQFASVCASPVLNEHEGSVQYRFGTPAKRQLTFPVEKVHPAKAFQLSHDHSAKSAVTQVGFTTAGHTYVVHEYGNSAIGEEESGVLVIAPDGQSRNVECGRTHTRAGLQALLGLGLPELPQRLRY